MIRGKKSKINRHFPIKKIVVVDCSCELHCLCSRASDPGFACKRGPNTRCAAEDQMRLSGPLLDRIDLHIEVPAVTASDLILPPPSEGNKKVARAWRGPATGRRSAMPRSVSTAPTVSAACIWRRHCPTARSPTKFAAPRSRRPLTRHLPCSREQPVGGRRGE